MGLPSALLGCAGAELRVAELPDLLERFRLHARELARDHEKRSEPEIRRQRIELPDADEAASVGEVINAETLLSCVLRRGQLELELLQSD